MYLMSFFLAFSSSLSFCADERLSASPRLSTAMAKNTFKRMTNKSSGKQICTFFQCCHFQCWCYTVHVNHRSNVNICKDTVSTDIQDDEINADENSWESWSTMSHNTIVHDGIPLLPSQDLEKTSTKMYHVYALQIKFIIMYCIFKYISNISIINISSVIICAPGTH